MHRGFDKEGFLMGDILLGLGWAGGFKDLARMLRRFWGFGLMIYSLGVEGIGFGVERWVYD